MIKIGPLIDMMRRTPYGWEIWPGHRYQAFVNGKLVETIWFISL